MAIRGSWDSEDDTYNYEVVQYKMVDSDHHYTRGASWDKFDSDDLDWARISVTREGGTGESQIVTFYGPWLDQDLLEGELEVAFDEGEYGEV